MDKQVIKNRDELKNNIDLLVELAYKQGRYDGLKEASTKESQGLFERNKNKILQAGMEGREVELRIGGRLFKIREVNRNDRNNRILDDDNWGVYFFGRGYYYARRGNDVRGEEE